MAILYVKFVMQERFVRRDRVTGLAAFYEGKRRPDRGNVRVSHKTVEKGHKVLKLHQEQEDNPMLKWVKLICTFIALVWHI